MSSTPLPSATVLLLRDTDAGLQVFMVVRHHRIDFAAGAAVFPGGKVTASDRDPALRERCAGAEGLDDEALALRVAAIREGYEECGVLLARPHGSAELLSGERLAALDPDYRRALDRGELPVREFLERENLVLACDRLVPFAHWITPELMPKRFDTHFYLAVAPSDQIAVHDGGESVDSLWVAPRQAVADADAGRCTIIFPTRLNLLKLAQSRSIAQALDSARHARVVTVLPKVDTSGEVPVLRIPADAGYEVTEAALDAVMPG